MSKKSIVGIGLVAVVIITALTSHPDAPPSAPIGPGMTDSVSPRASVPRPKIIPNLQPSSTNPQYITALQDSVKHALASLRHKHDEIEGTDFYYDKMSPIHINDRTNLSLYIGNMGGHSWLREENTYVASEWLFIQDYTLVADGMKFGIDGGGIERDNDSEIWEWQDKNVDDKMSLAMFAVIAHAKHATIRYNGRQYSKDRNLTAAEKKALAHVLDVYSLLTRLNKAKGTQ